MKKKNLLIAAGPLGAAGLIAPGMAGTLFTAAALVCVVWWLVLIIQTDGTPTEREIDERGPVKR